MTGFCTLTDNVTLNIQVAYCAVIQLEIDLNKTNPPPRRHVAESCGITSPSNDSAHNFLISTPDIRVSKTNSKGIACISAVSEKANESIGAAGFSDTRNAHRTNAVFMKRDLFAMCCPGQILGMAISGTRMYAGRLTPSYLRPKPNAQKRRSSRRLPSGVSQRWGSNFSGFGNTSGSLAIALRITMMTPRHERHPR